MESLGKKLMLGGSMAAMLAGITAAARAQEAPPQTEAVTVSASRINIQGYEAPTPVTVIGVEQLQRDAKVDLGDAIRELPSVGISDAPGNGSHSGNASQGDAGISTINLRGLGVVRTLVLFDGQRVVTSNPNSDGAPAIGGVDLSTIPTSLIERVDVVTGGASAAWGSDAVAGVVNLVVNKHFSGFKANLVYGNDQYQDHESFKGEVTVGTDLFGGRGHTEFAATYVMSPNDMYTWNRPWSDQSRRALYPCSKVNPGNPAALCHTPMGVYTTTRTNGGIILASAAGTGVPSPAAANALAGIYFQGPNATPQPFNYGVSSGTNCYACSANVDTNVANGPLSAVGYHSVTLFNYTSYKLTDDITASVMLNYGWNAENNQANDGRQGQYTIRADNPFIPQQIQNQMAAGGIPSFSLGTAAIENLSNHRDVHTNTLYKSIAQNFVQMYRQLVRGVFTLDGAYRLFGQDWSWQAYAQNSSVREREYAPFNTYNQNFSNAIDAITVTSTGANSLGGGNPAQAAAVRAALSARGAHVPQPGEIACRSALTATSWGTFTNASGFQQIQPGGLMPGCVPLNLFGDGNVTEAALNYIAPGRLDRSIQDQALYRMGQSVFSVSTQGMVPWGLPAGNIAVAFGYEYRLEQQRNQRDPLQLGASGVYESGNFSEYGGQYNVHEGFLELNVPVLKDQFVDTLDLNAAGRITSYSTSGMVQTWKLGATSQVNQDIKFRATLSSDIRAPGVGELFSPALISTQTVTYPPGAGGRSYNVHYGSPGNSSLVPEQAMTVSGGIVLTPHWIENLSISLDWYSITLHGGIFSPNAGQIFDQCANNRAPQFCALVFFARGWPGNGSTPVASEVDGNGISPGLSAGLGTFSADSEGALNFYLRAPVNGNRETVSGLDFQADYHHDLYDGMLSWHLVGNYTDSKTRTSLGVTVNGAGAVSGDGGVNPLSGFTSPKLRFTLSSTYSEGPWSLTAQGRLTGSARLSNTYREGIDVDDNSVPAVLYGDFRASYRWSDTIQMYGAIDNAFNAPPPNIATNGGGGTDCRIYDCIGRAYRIGVRFDH